MTLSAANLVLSADAAVDLQLHTLHSDGTWTPEALLGHLVSEGFGLAAITDHDCVSTVPSMQRLALEKHMPLLVAVEMTTTWRGEMTDVLCYGFDPDDNALSDLAADVMRRQQDNSCEVYQNLLRRGGSFPTDGDNDPYAALRAILELPSSQQPHALGAMVKRHGYGTADESVGKMLMGAGVAFAMTDIARVVDATHRSHAVCLIAHPGRGDGYPLFDADLLDEIRRDIPIDGFEVYYPKHSAEQIASYLDYARQHHLLTSAGSDSHGPDKLPVKYRAEHCRDLLERLGVEVR